MTARARYAARCLAGLLLTVVGGAVALAQVAVPPFTARVVDLTSTLSAAEVAGLESKLADFEQRKGSQIAVLIVPTTEPETIEDYGIRVAEAWKAGRRDVDDGAILLVAKDDRALRIEVGYGLEGALPDAVANRIVEDIIVPRFRGGDFAGGIEEGVDRMIGVIDGEPLPPPQWRERGQEGQRAHGGRGEPGFGSALPIVFILAFTLGATLKRIFGRVGGGLITGGIAGVVAWFIVSSLTIAAFAAIAAFVLSMFAGTSRGLWSSGGWGRGHGRRGGWGGGGFGGGGFGGGGFGGGGFGGGGGGGFGGGGASGRW